MLRRAAPIVRTLRSSTTVAQTSNASSNSVVVNTNRGRTGDSRKDGVKKGVKTWKDYKQIPYANEHMQLLKKHQGEIENIEIKSLDSAVERVNWYTSVTSITLNKVAKMMTNSTIEELTAISDRSMATLFSSFGGFCREMNREEKRKLMEKTVKAICEKGYSLGPFTRTSIFTAKVDMTATVEQLPSIVEELAAWESGGFTLTEDMVVQAARVYALQGDRKGVLELTNYARESFGRVESRFLEWIAFSMVSCGEKNGITAIEKLSRSAPDSSTQLWLSGALAAANRADLATTVDCLSRISLTSNITHSDKNGPVVDALIQLIERQVEGAEDALRPFLSLSGDGSSLHERHSCNAVAVCSARRAVNERKLEAAARLYALVHDLHKNPYVESELRKGLREMILNNKKSVEETRRCAAKLTEIGVIEDTDAFLLGGFRQKKQIQFITQLRSTGQLTDSVRNCKMHKFALAAQLAKDCKDTVAIPSMAALLLSTVEESSDVTTERQDIDRMLFKTAKDDPKVILTVLDDLSQSDLADAEYLAGQIATSAIAQILVEDDVLTSGRINAILESPRIPSINMRHLQPKIIRTLRNANDETSRVKAVDVIAQIIIASFKTGGDNTYAESSVLARLIGNVQIRDDTLELLVNKLAQSPLVGIDKQQYETALKELDQRNLPKRVPLLGMLRKKSQAYTRWLASSVEDLESEWRVLEKKDTVHSKTFERLGAVIIEKIAMTNNTPTEFHFDVVEKVIPTLKKKDSSGGKEEERWEKSRNARLLNSTEIVYGKLMRHSAMNGQWSDAHRLWKARDGLSSLPVASSLALSFHEYNEGSKELSKEIISTIRSNGQSASPADISQLGEILRNLSMEELEKASVWLKKELRLEDRDILRIKLAKTRNEMVQLISSGRLAEAFEVMKETSEKAHNAVGHFDIMRAAIRQDNPSILQSTVNLVSILHSKATAVIDLAYSFLMENTTSYASKLIKNPSIKISYAKMDFFLQIAKQENRMDVIHSLFSILVSCPPAEEKVANSTLNHLAHSTLSSYLQEGNEEKVKELVKEIEESTLVQERPLQLLIARVKNMSRSSSV